MDQAPTSPLMRAMQQVETINRIQELRSAGNSVRKIAAILQDEGRQGPKGGRWSPTLVWRVIQASKESNPD